VTAAVARPRSRDRGWLGWFAWVTLLASVAFAAWSSWSLWQAWQGSDDAAFAKDRDLVLRTGKQQVAVLNTMDWTKADAGLRQWANVATGPLHDQLQRDAPASRQKILQARRTAVATVDDAAVLSLDTRSGTAQLIATVQIRLTPQGGQTTVQRQRFEAGLSRTPQGWRLKSLTAIPVSVG
jgi:Mce-associated membrane protein